MHNHSKLVRMKITNLGCIGPQGITVELDDIVGLVGANNCGKSTVLRAYEAAVSMVALDANEFHNAAAGTPASVEIWVHIPAGTPNIDEKWKEKFGELLLVRSKWEWTQPGKPTRYTWDPELNNYSENGKAAGLDAVFNSRLPKPFRIGSLENPQEEHAKLLKLVLEPMIARFNQLLKSNSDLKTKVDTLKSAAGTEVAAFQSSVDSVQAKITGLTSACSTQTRSRCGFRWAIWASTWKRRWQRPHTSASKRLMALFGGTNKAPVHSVHCSGPCSK